MSFRAINRIAYAIDRHDGFVLPIGSDDTEKVAPPCWRKHDEPVAVKVPAAQYDD